MADCFLPFQFVSKGETLEVTGSLPLRDVSGLTVKVLVSQAVVLGADGKAGDNSPTGEGIKKGVSSSFSSNKLTVSVPCDRVAGTWTPGTPVAYVATVFDSSGKQVGSDSGVRNIEGGNNGPFALFSAFSDSGMAIDMADFR
ncbi:hypothetical protein [Streptomyces sp. MMG1121]|uniref:hypothetical protein n=1 Tax=Streptomyces sp. MMG1121 TaxID=1415544 RepID=UPI0006AFE191|nr:hypothetical protein [Streptomyces sp. MMG1121]KOV57220.1 hypothetical protein ADK64_40140 [Streptomyces sp. MMG1121]